MAIASSLTSRDQLMNWVCAEPENWQWDGVTNERLSLLESWIRQHRLGGWLYWRFKQAGYLDRIPPELQEVLRSSFQKTARKALLLRSDLKKTADLLAKNGIPSIALKGSYLQRYVFPDPGTRPMRDLDILVPRSSFESAWQSLKAGGYQPLTDLHAHPDKLLPIQNQIALLSPHQTKIEIHRAVGWNLPGEISSLPDFWAVDSGFWIEREGIRYLSPELLYIHLCIHHSWQHHWNIGPLGWVDLHLMSQSDEIDKVKMQQLGSQLGLQTQINTASAIYDLVRQNAAAGVGDLSLLFLPPLHDLGAIHKLDRLETYSVTKAIAAKLSLLDPKTNPGIGYWSRCGQLSSHIIQWIVSPRRRSHFATRIAYFWKGKSGDRNSEMRSFRQQLIFWYDPSLFP